MMEQNLTTRVDLKTLKKLAGGDAAFELKYINNFLVSVPQQLTHIKAALALGDGKLLYSTFHLLKAQLAFFSIDNALNELKRVELELHRNPEITEAVKKSSDFIFKEIIFACDEFEKLKQNYPEVL
jgi:hypothetical protein